MKNYDTTGLRGMIEQISTEQLDEMLMYELEKEPVDESAVRLIMEVLEKRDQNVPVEINPQVAAAWKKYQTHAPVQSRPKFSFRSWPVRIAAAVAVVIALALAVPQNAEAEGFWERLSRWTESIFEFFTPGDEMAEQEYVFETENPGLQQVYDAVVALGITDPVVPMWLPDGYELVECKVVEAPTKIFVYARFKDGIGMISLDLSIRNGESPRQYSKDEENANKLEIEGIEYNILHNDDWWTAAWTRDRLECAIAMDCQEETLHKILKSIYTILLEKVDFTCSTLTSPIYFIELSVNFEILQKKNQTYLRYKIACFPCVIRVYSCDITIPQLT